MEYTLNTHDSITHDTILCAQFCIQFRCFWASECVSNEKKFSVLFSCSFSVSLFAHFMSIHQSKVQFGVDF